MTKSNYVIWSMKKVEYSCVLDRLEGVEKQFEFRKGIPRAADFPGDARFTQNMDFPHNTVLIDNLINTASLIVTSGRLKKFLEARNLVKVEYLPVTILDHKNRALSPDYYIIHPIYPIDCLDLDKCGAQWGRIAKDSIKSLENIIIEESRVDSDREIFRLKYFYYTTLIRRDLAEAIDAEGFTGIRWVELNDYPE